MNNPLANQLSAGASLADILSAAKNIVTALNSSVQTASNLAGNTNRSGLASATLVSSKPGRLVNIVVTTAGSTEGDVNDAASLSNVTASPSSINYSQYYYSNSQSVP
jgi:deoxyhypusine synthase